MFNQKNETRALLERVEVLSNQKWEVINNSLEVAREAQSRMFDDVLLVLSGIEGKLKFAVSGKTWNENEKNIECDFTRDVVTEAKEGINNVRHAVTAIMKELREGMDKPLNLSVSKTLAEIE